MLRIIPKHHRHLSQRVAVDHLSIVFPFVISSFEDTVVVAHVNADVAGVDELDDVALGGLVLRAAELREMAVDRVHPAGEVACVELVKVVDALDVIAVGGGYLGEFETYVVTVADALYDVEDALAVVESHLGAVTLRDSSFSPTTDTWQRMLCPWQGLCALA